MTRRRHPARRSRIATGTTSVVAALAIVGGLAAHAEHSMATAVSATAGSTATEDDDALVTSSTTSTTTVAAAQPAAPATTPSTTSAGS